MFEITYLFNDLFNNTAEELNINLTNVNTNLILNLRPDQASVYLLPRTMTECDRYTRDLKSTSNGNRNILRVEIFEAASPYFIGIVCEILFRLFNSRNFPDVIRCATIKSIFKKGDRQDLSNYGH